MNEFTIIEQIQRSRVEPVWTEALRVVTALNQINVVPCLLGSLAVAAVSGLVTDPSDVDFQVRTETMAHFDVIDGLMTGLGYRLIDAYEHEYGLGDVRVAFASVETLEAYAGVDFRQLERVTIAEVQFNLPNLSQLQSIYQASVKDDWRKRKPKDVWLLQELSSMAR